jgi:hypothetical protein
MEQLAEALVPLVADGWHIWCQGDDRDDTWAIAFERGVWTRHFETKYYGTAYQHFLKEYGARLPRSLRRRLAAWWETARPAQEQPCGAR